MVNMYARYTVGLGLALVLALASAPGVEADGPEGPPQPVVSTSDKNDVSPPLRDIQPAPPSPESAVVEVPRQGLPNVWTGGAYGAQQQAPDPVVQSQAGNTPMPGPIQSFEGISNAAQFPVIGTKYTPPDTNGDVGPNHYFQTVNVTLAIYDKTGTLLLGPLANNTVWSGFDGPCETTNNGDPVVLYDHLSDRWLFSQFANVIQDPFGSQPFYQCVAVSQTGDPTGSWYRYQFTFNTLNDYPKFGVWPDGYYMMANHFDSGGYSGNVISVLERDKMLIGQPAQRVSFFSPVDLAVLPADLDGPPPPPGAPNYFVALDYNLSFVPQDALRVYEFHVDWNNTSSSSVVGPTLLATAAFDPDMCGYSRDCIPQPNPAEGLDAIADMLMYRVQYRNFGTYQTLMVNHTVDADSTDHAGIRWYELRNTGSGWSIYQQGTYAPDGDNRWMGSVAMDSSGNVALGYSVSSATTHPSIRYAGRLAGDPVGTPPQTEATLIAGGGSQTSIFNRWGDYSMMAVDPADGCTFWYTQEYYAADSSLDWQTRIGSFKFPTCASGVSQGTVLDADAAGDPIAGARVDVGLFTTFTDSNGLYEIANLQVGSYDLAVSAFGFKSGAVSGVSVVGGGTAVRNFALNGASEPPTSLAVVDRPSDEGGAIDLTWTPSTSTDVTEQRLHRGTSSGSYPTLVMTFNDTAESADSNEASATPADNIAPQPPTGLAVADRLHDAGGAIDVTWTPSSSGDVTEQRLYRATSTGAYTTPVQTFSSTTSSYTDTGLTDGVTHFYVVRAFDGTSEGAAPTRARQLRRTTRRQRPQA